ncbi:uncharacterized protein CIMG_11117 [Coccidioides immitis RS]|uniref:Uncharacterized protein n=1 Tax=Coccidioides immitis (strain RS) TaxID=246410 RepID=A0A0D8JW06_COCIM|nr:uncharacterized protein CIMG_11117 [Coccidioides immitis RS]KJF61497.1 hypothetical protein CIMG_11117 [Coccidioides immitis RS]
MAVSSALGVAFSPAAEPCAKMDEEETAVAVLARQSPLQRRRRIHSAILATATRSEALAETCGTAKRQRIPSADGTALVWCPSRPHTTPLDVRVNRGAEPHRDDALHG